MEIENHQKIENSRNNLLKLFGKKKKKEDNEEAEED